MARVFLFTGDVGEETGRLIVFSKNIIIKSKEGQKGPINRPLKSRPFVNISISFSPKYSCTGMAREEKFIVAVLGKVIKIRRSEGLMIVVAQKEFPQEFLHLTPILLRASFIHLFTLRSPSPNNLLFRHDRNSNTFPPLLRRRFYLVFFNLIFLYHHLFYLFVFFIIID